MTIADEARANSISCEMVKYAYRQTKDGVVVSFVVHPNDVPAELSTAHIGARYMVALVQIGDDETPVPKEPPVVEAPNGKAQQWKDCTPSKQAGIRCAEPIFWAFVKEEFKTPCGNPDMAAAFVRAHCKVNSRAHFNSNPAAKAVWQSLDSQFQAWKAMQQ